MPRVKPLTNAQRLEQRYATRRRWIADGLASFKNREKLNNVQIGAALGVGDRTVAKLLAAEDVNLAATAMLRLIDICGLTLEKKREVDL